MARVTRDELWGSTCALDREEDVRAVLTRTNDIIIFYGIFELVMAGVMHCDGFRSTYIFYLSFK